MIYLEKTKRKILSHAVLLVLLMPVYVYAQGEGLVKCSGPDCTVNDFFVLIKDVMVWIFRVAIAISSIMFAYAGFLVMTSLGRPGQISKAKGIFLNTAIGIIIMFTAYGIVWYILTQLGVTGEFNQFLTG